MGKGRSLRSLDDSQRAIPAYRRASSLRPDDFRAIRGLAACLESLGRHIETVELGTTSSSDGPTPPSH